jgi:type I restriction-modification system DNA methylase subunit
MALFQNTVIQKYINAQDQKLLIEKWEAYKAHFHDPSIQENIRNAKEEQYQEGFLRDLFVKILGYTLNPASDYNLTTELKNVKDSKKADGGIVVKDKVVGVIELKGTNTTDLSKIEAQAFGYKNNQSGCTYVITSNFEKLRFYIDNAIEHEVFNLFELSETDFKLLYLCLAYDNIKRDLPKKIKTDSHNQEDITTKQLYKDYSLFKRELYNNLVELNPKVEPLLLFKKSQKLLDRYLFLFFAEDRHLLPPNSVRMILKQWKQLQEMDAYTPLYKRFKKYFGYLNKGHKGKNYDVYPYNGGLFRPDEVLDKITIDDDLLYEHTLKLSEYDFDSEVDVNILGHIFENSLNEIEEVQTQLEENPSEVKISKRKKDGVFYTPKYITKYIVENTVGKLCEDKKEELELTEEDYNIKRQAKTKKALLKKLNDYRDWLLQLTVVDPACGSGAFLNEALNYLIAEHEYLDELETKLMGGGLVFPNVENSILENNLFGVDINNESVEIAKLSLWLRTAQPSRKLNDLSNNIKYGNSLIDDPEIAVDKAFNWKNEFPQVFEKGGFDVVIGNPPYVQLQKIREQSLKLKELDFETYNSTGDLYCLFYEKGYEILKQSGVLGYITSNKWMKANYGKSLRNYLLKSTSVYKLIDLGSGIFESATVDSNILFFKKDGKSHKTIAIDLSNENDFIDFNIYENRAFEVKFKENYQWVIESEVESNLKQKIENVGIPIKDWDIEIYRGVLTGFNEAFIISGDTKDELISKDLNSKNIIHPILRGRDINKYSVDFSDLYIIGTFPSLEIDIDKYPAVKDYLKGFGKRIEQTGEYYIDENGKRKKSRKKTNNKWFETQDSIGYIDSFFKEKIIYPNMTKYLPFFYDDKDFLTNQKCFILSSEYSKYFLPILNSKVSQYWIKNNCPELQGGTRELSKIYFENIPIPKTSSSDEKSFINNTDIMLNLHEDKKSIVGKFNRNMLRHFPEELEKLPKKLQDWYELSYADFIKELKKKKIKLSLSQESEWEDYFLDKQQKVKHLKAEIDKTYQKIDKMVYELYGLKEEEIEIVENS